MRVTLAQLEAFYWTAKLGSATRAARHLNLAQPTLSLRLKGLVDATGGAPLLSRTSGATRLTAQGQALLLRAAAIMTELQGIGTPGTTEFTGPIRIGLAEGFAYTGLPTLLTALLEDHPGLEPDWVVSTSVTLEASLLHDTLDMAVLLNPLGDERLRLVPLGAQPTCWVAPARWTLPPVVAPRDLWTLPVIANPAPSAMFRQVTGWFASAGLFPQRLSSCTSVAVIAELVAGGIGAGLLPRAMTSRYVEDGCIALLQTDPEVENGRLFIARPNGLESPKVAAVARTIVRVLDAISYLAPTR